MSPSRLDVGRVDKPHGVTGELVVTLTSNRTERVAPGARLWLDDVSHQVVSSRPHKGRHLVRFVGIDDREAAEALRGASVTAMPLDDDEAALWVHDLIGCAVVDVDGAGLGTVTAVEANPASDLLVLDSDALVPITFLVERRGGVLVVDPPEGLMDL